MAQADNPQRTLQVYVFSSNNLTNIWAGVGAGMWAVSLKLGSKKGTVTKARKVSLGSLGILYCSETHEFTTPFLFKSMPKDETVEGVWREAWRLPFEISPLGSPRKRLSKDELKKQMPTIVETGRQWDDVLKVRPSFSFQAMEISSADWAYLFEKLRH